MRRRTVDARYLWRKVPARTRMAVVLAVVAVSGLVWQHHLADPAADGEQQQSAPAVLVLDGRDSPGVDSAAPVEVSPAAARVTVERFATNFASPNGDRGEWLSRIAPDVCSDLLGQYQDTDIATVARAALSRIDGPIGSDPGVATFQVDYSDGSRLEVSLELGATGWKVSSVIPVGRQMPETADGAISLPGSA